MNRFVGRAGRLGLIMTSFEPAVRCSNPPGRAPEPDQCWEILQLMPATIGLRWFGRQDEVGVEVSLPWQFANRRPLFFLFYFLNFSAPVRIYVAFAAVFSLPLFCETN